MQCIKCEEGELKKIKFIATGNYAYACDYCRAFWMDGELIKYNTGHSLDPFSFGDDYEYAVSEFNERDQEHQTVKDVRVM